MDPSRSGEHIPGAPGGLSGLGPGTAHDRASADRAALEAARERRPSPETLWLIAAGVVIVLVVVAIVVF